MPPPAERQPIFPRAVPSTKTVRRTYSHYPQGHVKRNEKQMSSPPPLPLQERDPNIMGVVSTPTRLSHAQAPKITPDNRLLQPVNSRPHAFRFTDEEPIWAPSPAGGSVEKMPSGDSSSKLQGASSSGSHLNSSTSPLKATSEGKGARHPRGHKRKLLVLEESIAGKRTSSDRRFKSVRKLSGISDTTDPLSKPAYCDGFSDAETLPTGKCLTLNKAKKGDSIPGMGVLDTSQPSRKSASHKEDEEVPDPAAFGESQSSNIAGEDVKHTYLKAEDKLLKSDDNLAPDDTGAEVEVPVSSPRDAFPATSAVDDKGEVMLISLSDDVSNGQLDSDGIESTLGRERTRSCSRIPDSTPAVAEAEPLAEDDEPSNPELELTQEFKSTKSAEDETGRSEYDNPLSSQEASQWKTSEYFNTQNS